MGAAPANPALPLVFGHRGASGYRPENTLEALELAFDQGADAVEFDVVPTADGRLIVRHDSWLNDTTNVADQPEFASRFREITLYERWKIADWFSTDFTVPELKTLRATERLPDERPGSAKFDGQFLIPTLDDLLAAPFIDGRTLILEVKHGKLFADIDPKFDPVPMVKAALDASDWQARGVKFVFESFDFGVLQAMKATLGDIGRYVFLTERVRLPEGTKEVPADLLDRVAANFDGISVEWALFFGDVPEGSAAQFGPVNDLAQRAHDKGLTVFGWTARAEEAKYSIEEYYQNLIATGADGIFADQPDLLRRVVADLA